MTTWIDVASDAVKIGLGGLVGGLSALLLAVFSHRFKQKEETSKRQRETLDELLKEFELIAIATTSRARSLVTYYEGGDIADEISEDLYSSIEKLVGAKLTTADALMKLHSMEAKLTVVGFEKTAKVIDEYRVLFLELEVSEDAIGEDYQCSKIEDNLTKKRVEVFKQFASAYKSI